ncbi:hypothetical protein Hanom_Chr13g01214901 [Helianthus anomalus]
MLTYNKTVGTLVFTLPNKTIKHIYTTANHATTTTPPQPPFHLPMIQRKMARSWMESTIKVEARETQRYNRSLPKHRKPHVCRRDRSS